MPHLRASPLRDRMRMRFAEGDFEIGFSLVDMAEAETIFGNYERASQILANADIVFLDIQQILNKLGEPDREPFLPLLGELRRAIRLAKQHIASPH